MDIVWISLGAVTIVGVAYILLTRTWQRRMQAHQRTIGTLSRRVDALEGTSEPEVLAPQAPAGTPLERVATLAFRLEERFWEQALGATPEEMAYVRTHGKMAGSVKIERWSSHSVATIHEVLPERQAAAWKSRTREIHPAETEAGRTVTLWELALAPVPPGGVEKPATLELRLAEDALELCALHGRFGCEAGRAGAFPLLQNLFFEVPLDAERLAPFRAAEGAEEEAAGEGTSLYEFRDAERGIEWQLSVRDLTRRESRDRRRVWGRLEMKRFDSGN